MVSPLSDKLVQLGFTKNQAVVYEALIELGQTKASAIIKRTGLHRNIVYEALDDLVNRKLAFKTSKGGVAFFQLSDASSIVTDAQKQLQAAKEVSDEINALRQKASYEIKMYEGASGLESYLNHRREELLTGRGDEREILVLGNDQEMDKQFEDLWQKENKKRTSLGLSARMLFGHNSKNFAERVNAIPGNSVKLLPQSIKNPITMNIVMDSVGFILYDAQPFVISIQNDRMADSFRDYFETLWNQDAQVYRGIEAVQHIMEQALEYKDNWFIGGNGGMALLMPEYWKEYNRRRIEQGVVWHDLVDAETRLPELSYEQQGVFDPKNCYEFKWLPASVSSPSVIFFFGNTVANIIWDAQAEPVAFVIENKEVFDGYKKYFNYLWNQDVQITQGMKNVQQLFYQKLREMKAGEEYQVLWGTYGDETREEMIPWFKKYHTEARIPSGVVLRGILFEKDRDTMMQEIMLSGDAEFNITNIRYVSGEHYRSPMQINIYEDSVVMFHWGTGGDDSVAVEIKRKSIRDAMCAYFEGVWLTAKE